MVYVNLTITEIPKPLYLGLKVNVATLQEKNVTIEEVAKLLLLTNNYVIGLDSQYSQKSLPHYHIHFRYDGKYDAIQKLKARKLKDYGKSCKLFKAKDVEGGDPYAWYGYAVKEQKVFVSDGLDVAQLDKHAHTQLAFKKSQLKYGEKKEASKVVKQTFEESIFDEVDKRKFGFKTFNQYASMISQIALDSHNSFLIPNRLEYMTWKYLLTKKIITHHIYVSEKMRDYNIEYFN
ncbi:hypothetical protein [Shewanella sp.]|uniref:hypothetical protein n=1 Tax=Shewanella sp. TaxID=50422 RepID=UPI004048DA4B